MSRARFYRLFFIITIALSSCTATKFVPEGAYLLDEVKIVSDNKAVKSSDLQYYSRQQPNSKWFSLIKTQLYVYNLSGRDSTRWYNKFFRRIGDEPVIYRESDAQRSKEELTKAVQNMGYMGAHVSYTTHLKRKKAKIVYQINTGDPYLIRSLQYNISDSAIAQQMWKDSANTLLHVGDRFDLSKLDAERQRITDKLLSKGYFKFNKDYISYIADTVRHSHLVDLTLQLHPYKDASTDEPKHHTQYTIQKVSFIADYDILQSSASAGMNINDSLHYKGFPIYYKDKLYLRPKLLTDYLLFAPGELYDEKAVQRTYTNFGRLSALKYTNIRFLEGEKADSAQLNCFVMLTKSKHQTVSFEVEGTNSAGDLGAAAAVAFQHRNLFRGSESWMVKVRGAYEAITGLQGDYRNNNYVEFGAETTLNFPHFLFPFLSSDFKRKIRATSEFGLQYNYQLRPEFSRTVASASWSYKWVQRQRTQHRIDLLDISYLYLPWISEQFRQDYIDKGQSHIFEYNYKNRLIMRMGYSYHYNSAGGLLLNNTLKNNSYSIRMNIESAGNLLYAFSKATNLRKNSDGEYSLLNTPYAQYLKGDFDFAKSVAIDSRNALAFHFGLGVAVPYLNAKTIPFEKQYFSGGANSVRGWTVRNIGPGAFPGGTFLDQSGDIKLDANIEYRSKLFWKLNGALFVDAGNVWTIRNYENQPNGLFQFDTFYKQIAVAYGLGLRFDLDFFVLRFDGGMKAINPVYSSGKERYPITNPNFSRDFAFHFAVGYPF